METYCINSNLVLDSGENITEYLHDELSAANITVTLDNARERGYRCINEDYLRDKTAVVEDGATLAEVLVRIPKLKQIEIDLVLGDILTGAFIAGTIKTDKRGKFFTERAEKALKKLKYPASATTPVAGSSNIGNGTISAIVTNDFTTTLENLVLVAVDASFFTINGLKSNRLPRAEVGVSYPELASLGNDYGMGSEERSDYGFFPIEFTITAGATSFTIYDEFRFKTFPSSKKKKRLTRIIQA